MEEMKLNLPFEMKEVEIKETYIDEDGHIKERTRTALVPTGKLLTKEEKEDSKND